MSTEIAGKKYLHIEEVVEALKIKKATVRAYIRSGKIQGKRIGKSWLILESSLDDFLSSAK